MTVQYVELMTKKRWEKLCAFKSTICLKNLGKSQFWKKRKKIKNCGGVCSGRGLESIKEKQIWFIILQSYIMQEERKEKTDREREEHFFDWNFDLRGGRRKREQKVWRAQKIPSAEIAG